MDNKLNRLREGIFPPLFSICKTSFKYSAQFWTPQYKNGIDLHKQVQWRATKTIRAGAHDAREKKRQRRYLTVCNYLQEECREDRATLLRATQWKDRRQQTQVRAWEISFSI